MQIQLIFISQWIVAGQQVPPDSEILSVSSIPATVDEAYGMTVTTRCPADRKELALDKYDAITSATYGASQVQHVGVTLGLIKGAEKRDPARRFYEFALTEGRKVFTEKGFTPPAIKK